MRDFIGMEHFFNDDYARRIDHRRHSTGCEMSPVMYAPSVKVLSERERMEKMQPWSTQVDIAWIICLYRADVIDREKTSRLLSGLNQIWDDDDGLSGEERLVKVFDGNMDLASTVNYGRTLQEPMSRLKIRDKMLEIFDDTLELLNVIHGLCLENLDTIMVGHTHMFQGQPITYAHYMLSAFDGIFRSLEQLELAYKFTNLNSGGCGACSGTTWPVDREYMAEILGMDGVIEPTYDSEASQDHSMAIMFALSNMAIHLSRYSMSHYIWSSDEFDMIRIDPSMCGISSFMPHKCDSGINFEYTRIRAANVMGETVKSMFQLKSEFHGDVLQTYHLPEYAIETMLQAQACIGIFTNALNHMTLQKERMLKILNAGYSCSTELAVYLIKEHGYGGRLAHSLVATMVRQARVKGLKSQQCTGKMLDDAAEYLGVKKPGIDTSTLQKCFDPDEFIKSHNHLGGTAPEANKRLLIKRKKWLQQAEERQKQRSEKVKKAIEMLSNISDPEEILKATAGSVNRTEEG